MWYNTVARSEMYFTYLLKWSYCCCTRYCGSIPKSQIRPLLEIGHGRLCNATCTLTKFFKGRLLRPAFVQCHIAGLVCLHQIQRPGDSEAYQHDCLKYGRHGAIPLSVGFCWDSIIAWEDLGSRGKGDGSGNESCGCPRRGESPYSRPFRWR